MAAVDDHAGGQACCLQLRAGLVKNLGGIVRAAATAAKHQHAPGVAGGRDDTGAAVVVDAEEAVRGA